MLWIFKAQEYLYVDIVHVYTLYHKEKSEQLKSPIYPQHTSWHYITIKIQTCTFHALFYHETTTNCQINRFKGH